MAEECVTTERRELIEALGELLSAERAGVQVATASLAEAQSDLQRSILEKVRDAQLNQEIFTKDGALKLARSVWESQRGQ